MLYFSLKILLLSSRALLHTARDVALFSLSSLFLLTLYCIVFLLSLNLGSNVVTIFFSSEANCLLISLIVTHCIVFVSFDHQNFRFLGCFFLPNNYRHKSDQEFSSIGFSEQLLTSFLPVAWMWCGSVCKQEIAPLSKHVFIISIYVSDFGNKAGILCGRQPQRAWDDWQVSFAFLSL